MIVKENARKWKIYFWGRAGFAHHSAGSAVIDGFPQEKVQKMTAPPVDSEPIQVRQNPLGGAIGIEERMF